jgi:hypothetical protein
MKRADIEADILNWMKQNPWHADHARFERLALALFHFQFQACEPYARFCRSLERTPSSVGGFEEIPAVPTGAFKEFDLCCFELDATIKTFRTSGTSSDRRGRLRLDTLELYESSLLSTLREIFLDDLCGKQPEMHFLSPSAEEAPDSSLSHMFATLLAAEGGSGSEFHLREGRLDLESLDHARRKAGEGDQPMLIMGTSFAFVHFLDETAKSSTDAWKLPGGSRVMETGGFKGRSRAIPRDDLRRDLASRFGIPESSIVNQYGMTELGSQFYDSTVVDPNGPRRKLVPPWTRVRIIDPKTGHNIKEGEAGMIVIHDLANTGSIAAIQTADLGRDVLDATGESIGFDVLGRFEGAEERGCSIATDIMLDASRREPTT